MSASRRHCRRDSILFGVRRRYGTPADIPTVKAWWTADDHGTANMTDDGDGLISSWKDRIGGLELTASTTARPTWGATSFNHGYAGLTFDGSANVLSTTTLTGLPSGTTAGSIWLAASILAAGGRMIVFGGTAVATQWRLQRSSTRISASDGSGTSALSPLSSLLGVTYWFCGGIFSSIINVRFCGNAGDTPQATAFNLGTDRLTIGASNAATPANFATGVVRHAIICSEMTIPQRQKLEGFLAHSSGLERLLPFSHPYKFAAP